MRDILPQFRDTVFDHRAVSREQADLPACFALEHVGYARERTDIGREVFKDCSALTQDSIGSKQTVGTVQQTDGIGRMSWRVEDLQGWVHTLRVAERVKRVSRCEASEPRRGDRVYDASVVLGAREFVDPRRLRGGIHLGKELEDTGKAFVMVSMPVREDNVRHGLLRVHPECFSEYAKIRFDSLAHVDQESVWREMDEICVRA
jgi:hypothetical protein